VQGVCMYVCVGRMNASKPAMQHAAGLTRWLPLVLVFFCLAAQQDKDQALSSAKAP
jgi:hypothetical protein